MDPLIYQQKNEDEIVSQLLANNLKSAPTYDLSFIVTENNDIKSEESHSDTINPIKKISTLKNSTIYKKIILNNFFKQNTKCYNKGKITEKNENSKPNPDIGLIASKRIERARQVSIM